MLAATGLDDLNELVVVARGLSAESRHSVCSSLTLLSLLDASAGMPDPSPYRHQVTQLLARIEDRHE
jgi:hypothetical protein